MLTPLFVTLFHDYRDYIVLFFESAIAGTIAMLLAGDKGLGFLVAIIIGIVSEYLGSRYLVKYIHVSEYELVDDFLRTLAFAFVITIIMNLFLCQFFEVREKNCMKSLMFKFKQC
jgi:uncharacterized membrane protein YeaQ/YmgE (transglycosylase-associated protein family)